MRLSHLFLILATVFTFIQPVEATEKTRNLSGPRVHDEFTWPILGHWKIEDTKGCLRVCEFIVKPYSTHKAALYDTTNGKKEAPLTAEYSRDLIWKVTTPNFKEWFYVEYEGGKLYDEYGNVWRKVKD